ncbi:HIT domain-containing protein [Nocardia amamiensis]|uniref:HIT domain-containing protein n=1 Tax=Nocardia amamiensis TaxID=404578 RepID=A0ABS0CNS3_9NOCA|nr:HIT domain-containing protein [Nocardia amamiensis]MBF6298257.1 HIT domain-containing protein [Nocardia amamiensis]
MTIPYRGPGLLGLARDAITALTQPARRSPVTDWPTCPFCTRIANRDFSTTPPDLGDIVHFEPLNPVTPGHRLFPPGKHVEHSAPRWVEAAAWWAARKGWWGETGDEPYNLIVSSGTAATQTVAHVHIHYVPRRDGDGLHLPWTGQAATE